jgi:hypothetical protein
MSLLGRWRIVQMPDDTPDYPDMIEPAYILFGVERGEFAFGCVTGHIFGSCSADAVSFSWHGNDEMDEAAGEGWAKLQSDASLTGQICFQNGDDANFIARRETSSTAC